MATTQLRIGTQLTLLAEDRGSKSLAYVPVNELHASPLNPRRTRPEADVQRLAERMARNGYELTRAMWAYQDSDGYAVFAGGTRLEAANRANLDQVPIILHEGFSEEDLVLLAEQDNENDEYHQPVPIVDEWLSYKDLADKGWGTGKIAKAKGVNPGIATQRLKYANFPSKVLNKFFKNDFLKDSHALEIDKILNFKECESWLSRETAMLEVIEVVLKKTDKPTAKDFAAKVAEYNALYKTAQECYDALPEDYRSAFIVCLNSLQFRPVRLPVMVRKIYNDIVAEIAEDKRQEEEEAQLAAKQAEAERIAADRAEREAKRYEEWFGQNVQLLAGDFRQVGSSIADNSIDLIFTDPPYDQDSVALYGDLAQFAARVLKPGGSLITYVGHYSLPEVFTLMTPHLRYWWILSLDHSGAAARLPGKWVFVHWKPLLWFVKDHRATQAYVADKFRSAPTDKALHEWQQDVSEARYYIEQLTVHGDRVLDPFAGSGTTLIAGLELSRFVVGIEKETTRIDPIRQRIYEHYSGHHHSPNPGI